MLAELTKDSDAVCSAIEKRIVADQRFICAIAGPPGAGKSTLAEAVTEHIQKRTGLRAALVPMDGFHLDNLILDARGTRDRKGAPFTFDAAGFSHLVGRIAADNGEVVYPVFDRALDKAIAGVGIVSDKERIIVIEGNYLLLDDPAWSATQRHFDLTVMTTPSFEELERRLMQRWLDHGYDEAAARVKTQANDLANAAYVLKHSRPADLFLGVKHDLRSG